ncbi:Lactonase, 7-bladed beta-propeller-domain-containing protein [Aspergillus californicus]
MVLPLVLGLLCSEYAEMLLASSYEGTVTSLSLTTSGHNHGLTTLSQTTDCGSSPSWMTVDGENDILYCLDEGVDLPNATLTSFKINPNGSLAGLDQLQTTTGPVASAFYEPADAPGHKFLAIAHYTGSAVTTYSVDPVSGHFNHSQTFAFTLSGPGPVTSRQDAPHPHGVIVDPTGEFVLVPDLGADLVRIFHIHPTTGHLEEQQPLVVAPGSGPRHGVFWVSDQANANQSYDSRFYLVNELDNYLRGYDVTYSANGTILFSESYKGNTFGGSTPPAGSKVAEIAISPEKNNLVISNRNDTTFGPEHDSIALFSIADAVSFRGLYPAYGSFPRHFEFSPEGDMVAIALQNSHKVAVVEWDRKNSSFGPLLVERQLEGEVTAVFWDL